MEEKVKVIIDEQVTEALHTIQEPEEYGIITDGLEELNNFIYDHENDAKEALELLCVVRNISRLMRKLNGQAPKK